MGRDDFLAGTKVTLAHRAGFLCSNPGCRAPTAGPSREGPNRKTSIGVAAHISGASKGGPRYDASLSSDRRRDISNGIWLCQNCGKRVDDDDVRYTAVVLRRWKEVAESNAESVLGIAAGTVNSSAERFSSEKEARIAAIGQALREATVWAGRLTSPNAAGPPTGDVVDAFARAFDVFQRTRLDVTLYVPAETAAKLQQLAQALGRMFQYRRRADLDSWMRADDEFERYLGAMQDVEADLRSSLQSATNGRSGSGLQANR